MMPDVVVTIGGQTVGIELTAYSDGDLKNELGAFSKKVRIAARNIAQQYSSLQGCLVAYDLIETKQPPAGKVEDFAAQVLACAQRVFAGQVVPGDTARYPSLEKKPIATPFSEWSLLDAHVASLRISAPSSPISVPVIVRSNSASYYGTNIQKLAEAITDKERRRDRQCFKGTAELWLLIHADREIASSAITHLDAGEIAELLASPAAAEAKRTNFDRVILWDYVWGGYVDLVSGQHVTCPTD